jgi:ANTAR domain
VFRESADELMIRRFAGAQRDGIGRFLADPVSGRWSWSEDAYQIFGYSAGSVTPSWGLIISHIPAEDRAVAQAAYELAGTRIGPFSWSHRIHAGNATRSILILGETCPSDGHNSVNPAALRSSDQSDQHRGVAALSLAGYVIDLTELRVEGARGAATEAVQSSARHRAVIEQAKGALMLTFGLDAEAAFAHLVWHSQRSNRKVHSIAADLLAHLHEDGLGGNGLRLAIDRVLNNGEAPKKQPASAPPTRR